MKLQMRLTPKLREERRLRAVEALAKGMSQKDVAEMLQTSVASVSQWKMRFHTSGAAGLAAKPQGRPRRIERGSSIHDVRSRLIAGRPEEEGFSKGLWHGRAVAFLILRATGERLSRWTVLRYLKDWGLSPPRQYTAPGIEAGPPHLWLKAIAPELFEDARRDGAILYFLQGSAVRTLPPNAGKQDASWLLWARRLRGEWSFLSYPARPGARELEDFLERLLIEVPDARIVAVATQNDPAWTPSLVSADRHGRLALRFIEEPPLGAAETQKAGRGRPSANHYARR